jgi:type III secretion protein Y
MARVIEGAMVETAHTGAGKKQPATVIGAPEAGPSAVQPSNMTDNTLQLLHALGYIYSTFGQTKRALVLQLIAIRLAPDNAALLRTLAYTFLRDNAPDRTLAVLDRLRALGDGDPALDLLTSRALWAMGERDKARETFNEFLDRREQV